MRSTLILGVVAMATATTLLHCASSNESPGPDAGSRSDGAPSSDASVDAEADVSDAATEDEFEIPDGAVVCEASPCVIALTAARGDITGGRFCATLEDKTVQCWGSNFKNVLGYETDGGGRPMSSSPHPIPSLTGVTNVSLGGDNGCARVEDGSVYCWGDPALVSAGTDRDGGPPLDAPVLPTREDLLPPSTSVAVGNGTACVTLGDGGGSCWGRNDNLQLAQRTTDLFGPPTSIPGGGRTLSFVWPGGSSSGGWVFASATSGELLSWGASRCSDTPCFYILARDTSENPDPIPTIVPGVVSVRGMASGMQHVCAIVGREVLCWGDNSHGQLGRGAATNLSEFPAPTILSAVAAADDVDAGVPPRVDVPLQIVADTRWNTYVVMGSGRVYGWGPGLTSDNSRPPYEWGRPAHVDAPSGPVVALAPTPVAVCALLRTGAVECWGANSTGLLGRGIDTVSFTDPKPATVVFPH
jgi:Regulator of chromosome condensation (RCC1) repeat